MDYATLSNENQFTVFKFKNFTIRFKAPYSLEYYDAIKEWDNGYLVVMAKYAHQTELEEEYIDLVPILENLYIDATSFLTPIKEVRIHYAEHTRNCG
jgi:hypothetical protein